jgi:hypothetical protein
MRHNHQGAIGIYPDRHWRICSTIQNTAGQTSVFV